MLTGEGMLRRKTVKNNNRSNQQKQLCTCSTLSLYISLPFFCTTTTWNFQKLLSYTFHGWNVVSVPVHFFSLPHIFTLLWWPLAFLILLTPLQNFHVVLPTKKCLLFFLSLLIYVALFLVELGWPAAYFLFFSVFPFLHIPNLWTWQLKPNTLDNTDPETISAFRFRLYWLFSCLCFTRLCDFRDFPPK